MVSLSLVFFHSSFSWALADSQKLYEQRAQSLVRTYSKMNTVQDLVDDLKPNVSKEAHQGILEEISKRKVNLTTPLPKAKVRGSTVMLDSKVKIQFDQNGVTVNGHVVKTTGAPVDRLFRELVEALEKDMGKKSAFQSKPLLLLSLLEDEAEAIAPLALLVYVLVAALLGYGAYGGYKLMGVEKLDVECNTIPGADDKVGLNLTYKGGWLVSKQEFAIPFNNAGEPVLSSADINNDSRTLAFLKALYAKCKNPENTSGSRGRSFLKTELVADTFRESFPDPDEKMKSLFKEATSAAPNNGGQPVPEGTR